MWLLDIAGFFSHCDVCLLNESAFTERKSITFMLVHLSSVFLPLALEIVCMCVRFISPSLCQGRKDSPTISPLSFRVLLFKFSTLIRLDPVLCSLSSNFRLYYTSVPPSATPSAPNFIFSPLIWDHLYQASPWHTKRFLSELSLPFCSSSVFI